MGSAPDAILRFSTDDLPPAERISFCREVVGRSIVKLDMEPATDRPFRWEAVLRALSGLGMASITSSPVRTKRTRALVAADGNDDVVIGVPLQGATFASQRGFEAAVAHGEAAAMLNAEPGSFDMCSDVHLLSLRLPFKTLAPMIADLDKALRTVIPAGNSALRLLTGYVGLLDRDDLLAAPELRHAVAIHIQDLVALALGATRDAAALAKDRGRRAARLAAIKADIIMHLGQHDLSPTAVAARHRISPRYVRMLFEAEGVTFSEFVRRERLVRAYRMLTHPGLAGQTISMTALDAGFGDLSHFNRGFRRQFGCTPSDVRAAAQQKHNENS